jgi:hypothetical protein
MPLQGTFDSTLLFKDAGAVTADGAAQVAAAARVVDVGANSRFDGTMMVNVSALDVTSGDERYVVNVQGSNAADFSAGVVNLGSLQLGDSTTTLESVDSVTGLYELPFTNEKGGVKYRYLRIYVDVAGTTPSINFTAYAVKSAISR